MVILVLAMAALVAAPAEPTVARLSASQLLTVADRLERAGEVARALSIYEALGADPSPLVRAEATGRRAAILVRAGKPRDAAVIVRQLVDAQPERGDARIALARILDGIGDIEGARRQLRAAQAGRLAPDLARSARRYADALRARAPFGWSFEMSLAPDSNINRATGSDTLSTVLGDFELDDDARPRSGVGVAVRATAFARLHMSDKANLVARVDVAQDRYRDDDFNRTTLAVAAGPEFALGKTRLSLDLGAGRSALGGRTYQRWTQSSARGYRPLGRRTAVGVSLSGASVDNLANDLQDGRMVAVGVNLDRAITASFGVQAQLSANRFAARDPGYSTRSVDAALGGWLDLGRVTLNAGLGAGRLASDARLGLFPRARRDRSWRVSAGATARTIQVLTFSPFVRFQVERNVSTVEIWDYSRRRLEVGIQRAY